MPAQAPARRIEEATGPLSARPRSRRGELVESIAQGAVLLSEDGDVLAINDTARRLLDIAPGARTRKAKDVLTVPVLADAVEKVTDSNEAVSLDLDHAGARLRASVSMVRDEVLLLITDRTEEYRVEQLRRDFVANTSHELKTPVASIQTLAEALAVVIDQQPERTPELVHRLNKEASRLATLVHDLLDLRRLEEGGPMEQSAVDLAELVRLVVAAQYDRAERAEVELTVDAPAALELHGARGDLELIVANLLANAITYNRPGGRVTIELRAPVLRSEDDATPPRSGVELRVTDTGIGIPEADRDRIFERFYRVDAARSRTTGGTGLGLSIVRHAVDQHHGAIEVESLPADGTRFTVWLPAEPDGVGDSRGVDDGDGRGVDDGGGGGGRGGA